jgi:hypothetical protein
MTVYQACENNDGIAFDDKIEIVGEHGVTMWIVLPCPFAFDGGNEFSLHRRFQTIQTA